MAAGTEHSSDTLPRHQSRCPTGDYQPEVCNSRGASADFAPFAADCLDKVGQTSRFLCIRETGGSPNQNNRRIIQYMSQVNEKSR
jgi:hypothetical protein